VLSNTRNVVTDQVYQIKMDKLLFCNKLWYMYTFNNQMTSLCLFFLPISDCQLKVVV